MRRWRRLAPYSPENLGHEGKWQYDWSARHTQLEIETDNFFYL